jgi:hypothetical protein
MATSKLIACTLFIIVTLMLLGYYSNKNSNIRITSESHNIPFVIWPFQQDLATKQSLYTPYTILSDHYVAAIIEGNTTKDIQEVVNYLSKYPYIQEIYVYNRTGISFDGNNKASSYILLLKHELTLFIETEYKRKYGKDKI